MKMKRLSCCLKLRCMGYSAAIIDLLLSCLVLSLCSYYLYHDYYHITAWSAMPNYNQIEIYSSFRSLLKTIVNYILLHNFPDVFYVVISIVLWIKSLINFILATILIDGIKRARTICIASWLINTIISIIIEVIIYTCIEMKYNEIDATLDKRIIRSILFGIFIVFNVIFTCAVAVLCKILRIQQNETGELQESIVETTGIFQHVKV